MELVSIAHYFRGSVYCGKGDHDNGIADYNEAIRLYPLPSGFHAHLYVCRGTAYGMKGDFDKAIIEYTEAIRLQPAHAAEAYGNRG